MTGLQIASVSLGGPVHQELIKYFKKNKLICNYKTERWDMVILDTIRYHTINIQKESLTVQVSSHQQCKSFGIIKILAEIEKNFAMEQLYTC